MMAAATVRIAVERRRGAREIHYSDYAVQVSAALRAPLIGVL